MGLLSRWRAHRARADVAERAAAGRIVARADEGRRYEAGRVFDGPLLTYEEAHEAGLVPRMPGDDVPAPAGDALGEVLGVKAGLSLWVRVECSCGRVAAIPEGGYWPRCGACGSAMALPGASSGEADDRETRRELGVALLAMQMPERVAAQMTTAAPDISLRYPSGELEKARERIERAA